jgi:hypothetical protein
MKKFFAAILAILYMGTSIGATIQVHYCMGRFVEWKLRHNNHSTCSRCGMETKSGSAKGCCKDEYKHIKIDNDQRLSENYVQFNETVAEITPIGSDHSILYSIVAGNFAQINGPPPLWPVSLGILHCVFRV